MSFSRITRQPDNSPSPHSRTRARAYQPNSTSISVDTLFGHAMANAKPASSTSTQSVGKDKGLDLLDSLFSSAQQQQAQTALKPLQQHPPPLNDHAQEPVSKPNPFHIPDHMNPESLFAASSTQGAQRQRQKQPQHPQPQMQQVKVGASITLPCRQF